jgi:hypothetical protein
MSHDHTTESSSLDTRLAALPREQPPARDPWPQILASISVAATPPVAARRRVPLALAAGIALLVAAGFIGWQMHGFRQAALAPPLAGAGADGRPAAAFAVPVGAGYLATRVALERTYRERLQLLAPATRDRIEQDLATIRAANADIRQALAADPESAVLNRLLESTWQQEFDLYATVVRNTAPAAPRSRT